MAESLNTSGDSHAHSLIGSGAVDKTAAWSFGAADGNALLGPNGDDWARFGGCHLGIDDDSPDQTRGHWSYPFAKLKDGKTTLFRSAITAIRQRAGQQGSTAIFDAAGRLLEQIDGKKAAQSSAPMSLRAVATFDAEAAADGSPAPKGPPTFTMVANTGSVPMRLEGWRYPVVLDFAGANIPSQSLPIRLHHDSAQGVGHTTSIGFDNGNLMAKGVVSRDTPSSRDVTSSAKNGFPWQASVGASPDQVEFVKEGQSATANGRMFSGPVNIVRSWTLGEISFVDRGADGQTSATVAASLPVGSPTDTGKPSMFEKWLEAKGIDPTAISDAIKTTLRAAYDAEQEIKANAAIPPAQPNGQSPAGAQASPNVAASLDQIIKAQRDEDDRVRKITDLTAEAIKAQPWRLNDFEHLAKTAIAAKSTVAEFELALLRVRAQSVGSPAIHARGGREDGARQNVLEAAICKTGRLGNIEKHFDARTLEAADKHFKYGIGLQEVLMCGATANGYRGQVSDVRGLLKAAFLTDIRAEGFSLVNIPGILSNVMNKYLVDYFNSVESAWRSIAAIRNARDFKQISSYSLTGDNQYELIGPTGEIKAGSIGQTSYTNQVGTYGKILAITRQDIINDDLGALMRVPQRLGRGAALKVNDVFYTTFLGGVGSFWASGNANLISGGTTTLTAVGLTAALLEFRKQTDPDGKPLGITPKILLVPPEIEVTGKQLMNSTFFNTGGSSTVAQVPNMNTWQGAYNLVASTYLSNSLYTGNSSTAWFLIADPMDMPTIEVAFLNGREVPMIESAEAEFDTLGIQVRGVYDFGVGLQEQRGSVRSAGA